MSEYCNEVLNRCYSVEYCELCGKHIMWQEKSVISNKIGKKVGTSLFTTSSVDAFSEPHDIIVIYNIYNKQLHDGYEMFPVSFVW